jgi:hypothetical protein
MPFSILLLTAASPKRHISGKGQDKVIMEGVPKSGELVLFFQIDEDKIAKALNMFINKDKKKCCDGLIFYSPEQESPKAICLVEMKSNDLQEAEEQIKATKDHLMKILIKECEGNKTLLQGVQWKAYIYRRSSSPKQTEDCRKRLESTYGFGKGNVRILGQSDISSFLRGAEKKPRMS